MTEISVMALILILCITTLGVLDQYSVQMGFYSPLFSGTLTGLVLGDIQTGLVVGATLQLMSLGIAHYGGATIPDYFSASIMGTAYAIISGNGAEYGIGLAIPIALLLTQLDILARMSHSICKHYMDRYIETLDYRKFTIAHVIGGGTWILSRVFPVFIGLVFGEAVVSAINAVIPDWRVCNAGLRRFDFYDSGCSNYRYRVGIDSLPIDYERKSGPGCCFWR